MRLVIQRVSKASVEIEGKVNGKIEKLNLSLMDVKGEILSISQFTLYANCKKGRRPSFLDAAKPDLSKPLYEYFNEYLEKKGVHVETGIFGAMMNVSLINEGPTTIILDSKEIL